MQYCSIEEAWGKPHIKKKKGKKLYSSNIPKYIEDTSFLEGGHDNYCIEKNENNFSRKNKNKFIGRNRKKNPKRTPPVNISYDQASQEYRNFQLENSSMKNQDKNQELLVEGFESGDELNNIEELEKTFNDVDEVEYTNTEKEDIYTPSTNYATELETEPEPESESEPDIDDIEEIEEIVKNEENKNNKNLKINDIDYRLNNLNKNVNILLRKMDDSDFFDDDSQDNIHDLILFILFGVFMIFVLDTVHKLGKSS